MSATEPESSAPSVKGPRSHWRRWVKLALVVAWAFFIWSRSAVPGGASSQESLRVVNLVAPLLEALGLHSLDAMQFVVRKAGHFTEYFILGALSQLQPVPTSRGQRLAQVALLVAVPSLDETLQLFIPLREGALRDVAIDGAGAFCGVLAVWALQRLWASRRSQESRS